MSKKWTQKDIDNLASNAVDVVKKKIVLQQSTNELTQSVIKYMTVRGFKVWRQNNGGVYDPTKRVFRKNSSTPGISDVIGFRKKDALFVALEIKTGKDKLSDEQIQFLKDVNDAGGIGIEVRCIDDIINI